MQRRVLVYTIVIAASVAAIAGLLHLGESWFPAAYVPSFRGIEGGSPPLTSADAFRHPLALLIMQLLVIIMATQSGAASPAGWDNRR